MMPLSANDRAARKSINLARALPWGWIGAGVLGAAALVWIGAHFAGAPVPWPCGSVDHLTSDGTGQELKQEWEAIKDTTKSALVEIFLRRCGDCPLRAAALARLEELKRRKDLAATYPATTGTPSDDSSSDSSNVNDASATFAWPVRGRIIAKCGEKLPNGQANVGINIAVPEGTAIRAAAGGEVAYAGNELRGYGNLILLRHLNGYVTAYAHASELLVKRNDHVTQGQVIARAGLTGSVTVPQVHFEIRRGSTPVDPAPLLLNLQ